METLEWRYTPVVWKWVPNTMDGSELVANDIKYITDPYGFIFFAAI